jgi:hypothetical protein
MRSPRAQIGRPQAWSSSSVREVLHRDTYRGQVTWNRTRKRDRWGQKRVKDRPASEWINVPVRLANLTDTAAQGGAVPVVLAALKRYEHERQQILAELAAIRDRPTQEDASVTKPHLRVLLADWEGLLRRNVSDARLLLDPVLAGRIRVSVSAGRKRSGNVYADRADRFRSSALDNVASSRRKHGVPNGIRTLPVNIPFERKFRVA